MAYRHVPLGKEKEDDVKKSGEPEERVTRKPGKKKADSNQHVDGLGKEIFREEKVRSFIRSLYEVVIEDVMKVTAKKLHSLLYKALSGPVVAFPI